ncbi:hypothetical protein Tco_0430763, partial [Tanacetum coccineum]
AAKVKNIEGKLLGKDGKPLKSYLKTVSSKTSQGNPAGKMGSHSLDFVTNSSSNINPKNPTIAATKTVANVDVNTSRVPIPNDELGQGPEDATKRGEAEKININSTYKQDQPRKVHVSAMINDVKVQGANVAIPIAVVDEISVKFV